MSGDDKSADVQTDSGFSTHLKGKQRAQWRERQSRHRRNENEEQRQQRLSKDRTRHSQNCKTQTDEQKKQRREYMKKYMAQRRKSETPEQNEKRLSKQTEKQREYLEKMDDDKYYKMLDKNADNLWYRCRNETEEQREQRLYNKRLSYASNLNLMNEEELQQYREGDRKRVSEQRASASEEKKDEIKTKNREHARRFGHIYKRNAQERRLRGYKFERAKGYNLIPEHSDISSDTGSEPYLSYLQRNNLFKDRSVKGLHTELLEAVIRREARRKWGVMIDYKFIYNLPKK